MWLLKSISFYTRWFLECLVNRTSPNSNLGSKACEALGIYYSLMTYNISAPLPLSSPDFMRVSTKRTTNRCLFWPLSLSLCLLSRSWKKSHRFQAPKLKSLRFFLGSQTRLLCQQQKPKCDTAVLLRTFDGISCTRARTVTLTRAFK
jgi:hypothetical protein